MVTVTSKCSSLNYVLMIDYYWLNAYHVTEHSEFILAGGWGWWTVCGFT